MNFGHNGCGSHILLTIKIKSVAYFIYQANEKKNFFIKSQNVLLSCFARKKDVQFSLNHVK